MTLKEFIKHLNDLVKSHPEALDYQVVTSIDDEGNEFNLVYYSPTLGIYEEHEFIPKSVYKELKRKEKETNAICIN